jgi:hypothetical protein
MTTRWDREWQRIEDEFDLIYKHEKIISKRYPIPNRIPRPNSTIQEKWFWEYYQPLHDFLCNQLVAIKTLRRWADD